MRRSRLMVRVFCLLFGGCTGEVTSTPDWDVDGYPLAGRTYEGEIRLRSVGSDVARQALDDENVHLVSWPERDPVSATVTVSVVPNGGGEDLLAALVPDAPLSARWYAVHWNPDAPVEPPVLTMRLSQAVPLADGSFAWPFWGASGPFAQTVAYYPDVSELVVGFSDRVEAGEGYSGTVSQGDITCTLDDIALTGVLTGSCDGAPLDGVETTVTISGLVAAGTGEPIPQIVETVVFDASSHSASIPPPRMMPPPE